MQENVGKRRRKELREAESLRKDMKKCLLKCVIVFGLAIGLSIIIYAMALLGILITFENPVVLGGPTALVVISIMFCGADVTRYSKLKRTYKTYCDEHSITEAELATLKKA